VQRGGGAAGAYLRGLSKAKAQCGDIAKWLEVEHMHPTSAEAMAHTSVALSAWSSPSCPCTKRVTCAARRMGCGVRRAQPGRSLQQGHAAGSGAAM
jgi:hypothetical protein